MNKSQIKIKCSLCGEEKIVFRCDFSYGDRHPTDEGMYQIVEVYELWGTYPDNTTKVYEVFAETFEDACTKLINRYPGLVKVTNPSSYGRPGGN